MKIIVITILVETYHSIRLVECYQDLFHQIYNIIIAKLLKIKPEFVLQIFFKAFNDSIGLNGLVPTLLVFGADFCMTIINALSSTII